MNRSSVFSRVISTIKETFGVDDIEIGNDTVADDIPGWDSLSHTVLMVSMEHLFSIQLPIQVIYSSVGELVDVILNILNDKSSRSNNAIVSSNGAVVSCGSCDLLEIKKNSDKSYKSYFDSLLANEDVNIPFRNFNYACRFRFNPGAKYLSIQLHGDRAGKRLPLFARWNYGNILGAHVLSICDPTLYLADSLDLGWYLGTAGESAVEGIVEIAMSFAQALGISFEQVVFSGSSGGGFAAIQAATLLPTGKAIALNPQTDIQKHLIDGYVNKVSGCQSISEAKQVFGNRWNVIDSIVSANNKGRHPKIVYVQNLNDTSHYQYHYVPFAKAFDLSLSDDVSSSLNFMSILYNGPNSHSAESSEEIKKINLFGIPFLLGVDIDVDTSIIKTEISIDNNHINAVVKGVLGSEKDCEFACYLYLNDNIIDKKWYQNDRNFTFHINQNGEYKCRGYVKNKNGDVFSQYSNLLKY